MVMAVTSAVSALFLAGGALALPGRSFPVTIHGWAAVILLAMISQVFGQGLIAFGMSRLPAGLASVVLVLQPVLAAILGWIILGQPLSALQVVAGGGVVIGIYLARRGSLV
jgi:drug/metabolite transporter (DMT)-like permease